MPTYPRDFIDSFTPRGGGNCFVLMPFAAAFDDVYEGIRGACESPTVLLSCHRADDFYAAGHVMEDVLEGIVASEYVVADLTGKNPNVFYELGVAHACKAASKVVIISQSPDDVPFDLQQMRYIPYRNDSAGLRRLGRDLERAFLADSKNSYRFAAEEGGGPFEFRQRLSGKNRNFYTFTLHDLYVGNAEVKFAMTVHRVSLSEGNQSLPADYYHSVAGRSRRIPETDWEIRLDRTEQPRAFFTVRGLADSTRDTAGDTDQGGSASA